LSVDGAALTCRKRIDYHLIFNDANVKQNGHIELINMPVGFLLAILTLSALEILYFRASSLSLENEFQSTAKI